MDEEKKAHLIAEAENIEAIRDFFTDWYSVAELYETAAKATTALLRVINHVSLDQEERQHLREFTEQHLMMIDRIKLFEMKDGE